MFTVYVSARRPRGGLGASWAVFMCVDEIELRLPVSLVLQVKGPDVHPSIMLSHADSPQGPVPMLLGVLWTLDLTDRQPVASGPAF